jgi:hypothetical protein
MVALVAALAPAHAVAQEGPPKPVPGRNFVGAQIDASKDPYKQLIMLSTRVVDGGNNINVWLLAAPAGCGGSSSVGVRKVPIGGQGRFHAELQMGTRGARRGTATVDGQFARTKRNGVVARTVIRARMQFPGTKLCDTGDLRVRALSPKQGRKGHGAGRPAPNALFVGTLQQRSSRIFVQEPMLALISRSGTQVKRFLAVTNVRCKSGREAGGIFRIRDIAIKNGSFDGVTGNQSPVPGTQEKRTIVLNAKGTFGANGLTGTWHVREIQTDPYGNTTDDCNTGNLGYSAARGAR